MTVITIAVPLILGLMSFMVGWLAGGLCLKKPKPKAKDLGPEVTELKRKLKKLNGRVNMLHHELAVQRKKNNKAEGVFRHIAANYKKAEK